MALMSPPIPVAESPVYRCVFNGYLNSVNIAVHFFTDAAGRVPLSPLGTGSRNVTVRSTRVTAHEGDSKTAVSTLDFQSLIYNGTAPGLVSETLRDFDLGSGLQNIEVVAAPNTTPGTAVTYRILVDANGSSALVA